MRIRFVAQSVDDFTFLGERRLLVEVVIVVEFAHVTGN